MDQELKQACEWLVAEAKGGNKDARWIVHRFNEMTVKINAQARSLELLGEQLNESREAPLLYVAVFADTYNEKTATIVHVQAPAEVEADLMAWAKPKIESIVLRAMGQT